MNFTEAYVCNINRTQELSRRMNRRVYPSENLQVAFIPRPVETKRVLFPILDARKKFKKLENRGFFSSERVFSPGDKAPYNGFMSKVDDESKLRNIIFPIQTAPQSKFIPDTKSDLYDSNYLAVGRKEQMLYPQLYANQKFDSVIPCNSDQIGNDLFYNHTRQQTKDLRQTKKIL